MLRHPARMFEYPGKGTDERGGENGEKFDENNKFVSTIEEHSINAFP